MPEFHPVDLIVLMIAGALMIILLVAAYSIGIKGDDLTPTREKILNTLLAGALSAVSMFIGARLETDPCCALLQERGEIKLGQMRRNVSEEAVQRVINEVVEGVKKDVDKVKEEVEKQVAEQVGAVMEEEVEALVEDQVEEVVEEKK